MQFTGIDAPYEPPITPEIHLHTDRQTIEQCTQAVADHLRAQERLT